MNTLDDYSLTNIFSQIPTSLPYMYCTCNHIKKIIDDHIILHHLKDCREYELLCEHAVKNDHFDCFTYFVTNDLLPESDKYVYSLLMTVMKNDVQYVKYLNEHTNLVKPWLGKNIYYNIINFNGNTEICKYLLENNLTSSVDILVNASAGGDLKCLQYICTTDSPVVQRLTRNDSGLLDTAIYHKQYDCAKFLHEQGLAIHPYILPWHSWFTNFKCKIYCSFHNANVALDGFVEVIVVFGISMGIFSLCHTISHWIQS